MLMLLTIASVGVVTMTSAQLVDLGPPVLPDVLSALLDAYKPLLSGFAQANLPATIGNCKEANAPTNCTDIGNLYDVKNTFYRVKARWISGINTMRLDDIAVTFHDKDGSMALTVKVYFAKLPVSLLVEACAGVLGCATFLDTTKSCCGTAKTVTMTATAKCSERPPFLHSFVVGNATISPGIAFTIDVFGHTFKVADITSYIIQGVKDSVGKFVATQGFTLVNSQLQSIFGDKVYCSRSSRDADKPPLSPVTMPPTMTPDAPATTGPPNALQTLKPGTPTTKGATNNVVVTTTTAAPPSPNVTNNLGGGPQSDKFTNGPSPTRPRSSSAIAIGPTCLLVVIVASTVLIGMGMLH